VGDVNNGVLKRLVAVMARKGLSPKTIENYIQVPKMVVASDGHQVYPRKWNHEFIDMPVVEQSDQNRPSFSTDIMTGLAQCRHPREHISSSSLARAGSASVRHLVRVGWVETHWARRSCTCALNSR
jgi:hypothetical protein